MTGISAASMTVLVRVTPGAGDALLAALAALEDADSPFAAVPGTHFGRWVFIDALTGADGEKLAAEGSFLLMNAEFDPTPAEWTAALCARSGPALDAVMGHCEDYPGSDDAGAVVAFFADHRAAPGFTVAGHRPATVTEIRDALALRERLRALAIRAQREQLSPAQLRAAWHEAVGR